MILQLVGHTTFVNTKVRPEVKRRKNTFVEHNLAGEKNETAPCVKCNNMCVCACC